MPVPSASPANPVWLRPILLTTVTTAGRVRFTTSIMACCSRKTCEDAEDEGRRSLPWLAEDVSVVEVPEALAETEVALPVICCADDEDCPVPVFGPTVGVGISVKGLVQPTRSRSIVSSSAITTCWRLPSLLE